MREKLRSADVLLIGARRPDLVAAQWVRPGCVLLDLGLSTSAAPPLDAIDTAPPSKRQQMAISCDVLCLGCSDGLSAMTAALRMRNASHVALEQQGFLEPEARAQGC